MQKASYYNKIPQSLVRKLGNKEVVVYRLEGIKVDTTPENRRRLLIPFNRNVPSSDTIIDPETDESISIAYIRNENVDGSVQFGLIDFYRSTGGLLVLRGSQPEDRKKFQYLELCNYNKSNPNRNTTIKPIFHKVEKAKEAKEIRNDRAAILKAVMMASNFDDTQVRNVAALFEVDPTLDLEVLRNEIEQIAEEDPVTFVNIVGKSHLNLEALLKRSQKMGIIKHDMKQKTFYYGETPVYTYKAKAGDSPYGEFANALTASDPEGLVEILLTRVQAAETEAV